MFDRIATAIYTALAFCSLPCEEPGGICSHGSHNITHANYMARWHDIL